MSRIVALALAVPAVLAALPSCGSAGGRADGRLQIEASFYPLQWIAEEVGGRFVAVDGLTPPGAEPHDLELSPRAVGRVQDADLVVYLSGFQPSVDEAVDGSDGRSFDARDAADLDRTFTAADEREDAEHQSGTTDPHFWLDPLRLQRVAEALGGSLADIDPAHAETYRRNAAALGSKLRLLHRRLRADLVGCRHRDLVTTHEAFGYLADRYGLRQVGIVGLTAEGDPSPRDLADMADYVEEHRVRTVYVEPLVSKVAAETVAEESGARVAELDPIEGLDDDSRGRDYIEVMDANRRALVEGQPCT